MFANFNTRHGGLYDAEQCCAGMRGPLELLYRIELTSLDSRK